MRNLTAVLVLIACQIPVYSADIEGRIGIGVYVERFLAQSVEVEGAAEAAEQADQTYENARINQQSAYNLALLKNEHLLKQAEVQTTENSQILLAVHRVFSVATAATSLEFSKISQQIAEAEYRRAEELAAKDYISAVELRASHAAFLQSISAFRAASEGYAAAYKALCRPLGASPSSLEIEPFPLSFDLPQLPELALVAASDAISSRIAADLSLYEERRTFLSGAAEAPLVEVEAIEEAITYARRQLLQRYWELEDALDQLEFSISGNVLSIRIGELNVDDQLVHLEQARHYYEEGQIHSSDLTQAQLTYDLALNELINLRRDRFLLVLEALDMLNVQLKGWIRENFVE